MGCRFGFPIVIDFNNTHKQNKKREVFCRNLFASSSNNLNRYNAQIPPDKNYSGQMKLFTQWRMYMWSLTKKFPFSVWVYSFYLLRCSFSARLISSAVFFTLALRIILAL